MHSQNYVREVKKVSDFGDRTTFIPIINGLISSKSRVVNVLTFPFGFSSTVLFQMIYQLMNILIQKYLYGSMNFIVITTRLSFQK